MARQKEYLKLHDEKHKKTNKKEKTNKNKCNMPKKYKKTNKIREYVTINPGTEHGGGITTIGDNCLFMISYY